jgi:hypothetical protein
MFLKFNSKLASALKRRKKVTFVLKGHMPVLWISRLVVNISLFLGYDAVSLGNPFPTFRRKTLLFSSVVQRSENNGVSLA